MKRALWAMALVTSSAVARAETALSVDANALWRVDLTTHEAELISSLGTPDPWFRCEALAASSTGLLRCSLAGVLYDIRAGAAQALAPIPVDFGSGLTFDAKGRLWLTGGWWLWQLDPITGAQVEQKWLTLGAGCYPSALAARGNQLFVFTRCSNPNPAHYSYFLQEIDPSTGASLSAVDISSLGVTDPIDAAFDANGDLWFSENRGGPVMGIYCFAHGRLRLSPLSMDRTWEGCIFIGNSWGPVFTDFDAVEGPSVIEVPAVSPLGAAVFMLLIVAVAWRRLRLARRSE